ncbi:hypothetical protein FVE85_5763 [Porphyridium purpureum]|uniref:Uncharacterized protein n=1 Tax=Porphyridium purpureum TaxID=35688 RepID=A0A5J4Z4N0_PORPP|nr:hypothetical protein FVE85_5763 [Porphyridium purpureum]|eukprot:POR3093..scf295_1
MCAGDAHATRRDLLRRILLVGISGVAVHPQHARAAVPTLDEYAGGQGSVKRSGGSFLLDQSQKSRPSSTSSSASEKLGTPQTVDELTKTVAGVAKVLDTEARALIRRKAWDDLFALLGSGDCMALLALSKNAMRIELLPHSARAASVAETVNDLRTAIQALKDRAFGNRVVFFNGADRRNVEIIAKDTGYSELNGMDEEVMEALAYLDDAIDLAGLALEALQK